MQATRDIIAYCDHQFGRLLDWWDAEGRAAGVQIIAISDYGHITGHSYVSVTGGLRELGFRSGTSPAPDVDVVVVPGQVGALYLAEPDERQISRLVAAITSQNWCGPVFTRSRDETQGIAPGSLGNHLVLADHARAPDISFAFRADDGIDAFGLVGRAFYEHDRGIGLGIHGGLHPKELAAVGILAGSAFINQGSVSTLPTGICDFAPTILHLLGIASPPIMTGRILEEVLAGAHKDAPVRSEALEARLGGFTQVLRRIRVGSTVYIDSGMAQG